MTKWSRSRLEKEGQTIFGLSARPVGHLFREEILQFTHSTQQMPYHRFAHGDMVSISLSLSSRHEPAADDHATRLQVLITRNNPLHEKPIEGVVLEKSKSRLQVVVKDYPANITEGTWVRVSRSPLVVSISLVH